MAREILAFRLISIPLLSGVLLLAAQTSGAAPFMLDDDSMNQVTAGATDEAKGVVVGNSAISIIKPDARLKLSGEAQQAARGLNLINSSGSAIANVVNVWDGAGIRAITGNNETGSEVGVNQINTVTQEQPGAATVSGYLRSEAEHGEYIDRSGSASHSTEIVDHHSVTAISEISRVNWTSSTTGVDTSVSLNINDKLTFDGHLGQGFAAAGNIKFLLGMVETGNPQDPYQLGNPGSADIAFTLGDEDANLPSITATESPGGTKNLVLDGNLTLLTQVRLPSFAIEIEGVGCAVAMGSCNAVGSSMNGVHVYTDNSTLDIVENHQSGQVTFSESQTRIHRSPFELGNASADYIVIDDSMLELDSEVLLELTDSAQKDASGINLVNAINSNVANATNLSRAMSFEGSHSRLVLNQFNTVRHGH